MGLPLQSPFLPFRTDVLFLLVGANPLPNYVAVQLLARDGATVYLLHTEAQNSTLEIATHLRDKIIQKEPSLKVILSGIHDSDGEKISTKVTELLSEIDSTQQSVGLNYTGGTKPMAIHTYQAIKERFPNGCFSYLDPRSQRMFVHKGDGRIQTPPVGRQVEVSLEEILALHGYKLPVSPPRNIPKHPELSRAIATIHSTTDGFKAWREWLKKLNTNEANILKALCESPLLGKTHQVLSGLCKATLPSESQVANLLGYKDLRSCLKFLQGLFLEEYTLDALVQISGELGLIHYGTDMHPRKRGKKGDELELNLDVAATAGYQLFAISCQATDYTQKAKEHLLEIFVRARQLGGDEARFGLVCCLPNPERLQQEVEQSWDAEGKIRVFGQRHLLDLPAYLKDWFETANREMP